jgi:serine/threonine protein kinase
MFMPSGTMLGRYRIEEVLGEGQAGVVYQAFDTAIERTVAIKCLRAGTAGPRSESEGGRSRARIPFEEAKVIGRLNHPHIAAVFDMGESGNVPYIVMEHVQGETLKSRLTQSQTDRPSLPQILSFIVMVARALHYVHQRGILHGDIKPANIIVTPSGTPKIMDFGVARRSLTERPGAWSLAGEEYISGTPGYLAPEALAGSAIDARADVFSLGVIAYEWLAGRKPFRGDSVEATMKAVSHGSLTPLCELGEFDSELSRDLDQALARDPAQRFASADAMADALEICQEHWLKQSPKSSLSAFADGKQFDKFLRLKGRNILFSNFSQEDLGSVMQLSRRESYREGDTILREGVGGSTMYVVVRGRVSVRKMAAAQDVEIKQIPAGECFGEMAVISQMPRSASVVAIRPTEVLAISGAVLRSASPLLCMKLYRNIASLLSDRVREMDEQVMALSQNDQEKPKAKRGFPFW